MNLMFACITFMLFVFVGLVFWLFCEAYDYFFGRR